MSMKYPRQSGFTVVELLTAVFITMIMMLLIARIFSDTAAAVGDGIGLSEVMAKSRSISDQLTQDLRKGTLVGPSGKDEQRAFLVIANRRLNGGYLVPGGGEARRDVRSDQLFFFIRGSSSAPLRPGTPGFTDSFFNPATADTARVWYGHVLPIRTEFTSGGSGSFQDKFDALGVSGGSNEFCTHWVLGRQALLLADPQKVRSDWGLQVHADDARVDNTLVSGVTDVAAITLDRIIERFAASGGLGQPIEPGAYGTEAIRYGYLSDRVRGRVELGSMSGDSRAFAASEIAQLHTVMATNCSDFIVEFAGRYDAQPDEEGLPDTVVIDNQKRIKWYGAANVSNMPGIADTATGSYPLSLSAAAGTTEPVNPSEGLYVFRHDDVQHWPWLLRIRYRLHDKNGRLMDQLRLDVQSKPVGVQGQDNSGKWFELIVRLREVKD